MGNKRQGAREQISERTPRAGNLGKGEAKGDLGKVIHESDASDGDGDESEDKRGYGLAAQAGSIARHLIGRKMSLG
jgi:hypothetical protein